MRPPVGSRVAALLSRVPIALFGLMLAASGVHASCGGVVDASALDDLPDGGLEDPSGRASRVDAWAADAPSQDAPEDRAEGMSYGDAYLR